MGQEASDVSRETPRIPPYIPPLVALSDSLTTCWNIFFPDRVLAGGRDDLVAYAGEQLTTGEEAEAHATYIQGHLGESPAGRPAP